MLIFQFWETQKGYTWLIIKTQRLTFRKATLIFAKRINRLSI